MNPNPDHYVIVGRVAGVFGVRGWVKIRSDTEPHDNILNYSPWYLHQDGNWVSYKLVEGRRHGKGLVAHLESCDDRDVAAGLVGQDIAITREQMPPAGQGEYYWADLIGLEVFNLDGKSLGKVDHLMETGANDVLVVRGEQGECLIPYILERYIMDIDLDTGKIQVDWQQDY
jgi:16S rRNA processing protein RimM